MKSSKLSLELKEKICYEAEAYTRFIAENFPDRDADNKESDHDNSFNWIRRELKKIGYKPEQLKVQKFGNRYRHSGKNLILTVEGKNPEKNIVAATHYDGDGVGDNASGTALLLAATKVLCGVTPRHTVHYVFMDCEETGCQGATAYVDNMTDEEAKSTLYMINLDALLFGDYCNVYGGYTQIRSGRVIQTSAYKLACDMATEIGMKIVGTKELDGYFKNHKTGPAIETDTIYTNPWTKKNPAPLAEGSPASYIAYSPSTIPYSNHAAFKTKGIPYVYFEATNWFAAGTDSRFAYTGYLETYDTSIGDDGMFMNTPYDNLNCLEKYFPERMKEHYAIYGPLLISLIMH